MYWPCIILALSCVTIHGSNIIPPPSPLIKPALHCDDDGLNKLIREEQAVCGEAAFVSSGNHPSYDTEIVRRKYNSVLKMSTGQSKGNVNGPIKFMEMLGKGAMPWRRIENKMIVGRMAIIQFLSLVDQKVFHKRLG